MKTLNDIMREYHELEDALFNNGGELTDEIEAMFEAHDTDFNDKLDRYAGFIGYCKTQIAYLEQRKAELDQRMKSLNTTIESMRERMLYALQSKGLNKLKTAEYTYSVKRSKVAKVDTEHIPHTLRFEMIENGCLQTVDKFNLAQIKKDYADESFVLIEEKDTLALR